MSYTRLEHTDGLLEADHAGLPPLGRLIRVGVWSVINVALVFAEHLAEFLAPLCLLAGALWWTVPRVLATIQLDGAAADLMLVIRNRVPTELYLDGTYYSAHTLVVDGLWLFAAVAVARTLQAALASLLLDNRP